MDLTTRLAHDLADVDPHAPEPTKLDGLMPITATPAAFAAGVGIGAALAAAAAAGAAIGNAID